jgi:hypothetical protein
MAKYVREIMNPELFAVLPEGAAEAALADMRSLGITGAPVVDRAGFPLGVLSIRDLTTDLSGRTAGDLMNAPALVIDAEAPIEDAARLLGESGYHRLVVVNAEGHAVGLVSVLDVIRAVMGMPARHPSAFPHYDAETGLVWSDPADLVLELVEQVAAEGPGVLVLVHDPPGIPEAIVWAEAAEDVAERLREMVSAPQAGRLGRLLAYRHLRFKTAAVPDRLKRARTLSVLKEKSARWPRP